MFCQGIFGLHLGEAGGEEVLVNFKGFIHLPRPYKICYFCRWFYNVGTIGF